MGFTWTEDPLLSGYNIKAVHVNELRDALDWLDDNCPCLSNNSTDNNPVNITVNGTDNGTYNNDEHATYDGTDDGSDNATNYGSDDGTENTTYESTNDVGDDGSNNVTAQYAEFTTNNAPDHTDYNNSFDAAVLNDDHRTYEGVHDGTYNNPN